MITPCMPANNGQASEPSDPESWDRNYSTKVRETRSSSGQKRSERDGKCWQHVGLGIHGLRTLGPQLV